MKPWIGLGIGRQSCAEGQARAASRATGRQEPANDASASVLVAALVGLGVCEPDQRGRDRTYRKRCYAVSSERVKKLTRRLYRVDSRCGHQTPTLDSQG